MATFVYKIADSLYLNITNRCSCNCSFCIRSKSPCLAGYNLILDQEPTAEEIIELIPSPEKYREFVFCGYGEPTFRLDTILEVCCWLKENNSFVRLDTNGHGDLINQTRILPLLKGKVDHLSVSLNAASDDKYQELCSPTFGAEAFPAVCTFIREAVEMNFRVTATAVAIPGLEIKPVKELAETLGAKWRTRMYN